MFEGINIDLAAEHGAFYKSDGEWKQNMKEKPVWDDEILANYAW